MRASRMFFLGALMIALLMPHSAQAASAPAKVTIHVPSKSLSIMPYYFGKDKGFFAAEQIEPQLVMMAPPTAIAALVAGELDFSSTTGAATTAYVLLLGLKLLLSLLLYRWAFQLRREAGWNAGLERKLVGSGLVILLLAAVLKTIYESGLRT